MKRLLSLLLAAIVILAIIVATAQEPFPRVGTGGGAASGRIRFLRDATSSFDGFITDSTPATRKWMREHYWRLRGYPPFTDQALTWAPPTQFYDDLYAIYRERRSDGAPDFELLTHHPDWVLRDVEGRPLYIPYDCGNGSCPQYAANVGNQGWRDYWIARANQLLARGYSGIFVDDVNLEMKVGDGDGREVAPVDPRTGEPMTLESWRRYVTEFAQQIRRAFPKAEITHNVIWFADHQDPWVEREILSADYIQLERGFTDPGIASGRGRFGYEAFLSFINWLHGLGRAVILKPYDLNPGRRLYELANYFLINEGRDAISSEFQVNPDDWWSGWETDLGAPEDGGHLSYGLLRRDFENGTVVINPPGAPPRRFEPDGDLETIEGGPGEAIRLNAGQGEVLLKAK